MKKSKTGMKIENAWQVYFEDEILSGEVPKQLKSRDGFSMGVLNERLNNKEKCLEFINEFSSKRLGFDVADKFGIPSNYKIKDIPQVFLGPANDTQQLPMPFEQDMRKKFLDAPKVKLFDTTERLVNPSDIYTHGKDKKDKKYNSFTNFYASIIDGQTVLFKEECTFPNKGNFLSSQPIPKNPAWGSYEVKAIVGGDAEGICECFRFDFNPQSAHGNFTDKKGKVLKDAFPVWGSHIHNSTDKYQIMFPNRQHSAEVFGVDTQSLNFANALISVREACNMGNNQPLFGKFSPNKMENVAEGVNTYLSNNRMQFLEGSFEDRVANNMDKARNKNWTAQTSFGVSDVLYGTREVMNLIDKEFPKNLENEREM